MFQRTIRFVLQERLTQFPIVALTGPRQSGKTTLLESLVDGFDYINLEAPDQLERIRLDPRGTLHVKRGRRLIIDEAQNYPEIFSYIQVHVDEVKQKGQFILSGSQNFLLNQHITQSLAGRTGLLELLPLTYQEYQTHPDQQSLSLWAWLYQGTYPRPYQDNIPAKVWAANYVKTYLERDVRDLLKVHDLNLFQRFLRLCAGRHGQLLNLSQLAIDCGISHTTVLQWLSVLEASYLIFRLSPYHENFNKRLIKSAKLYFYDPGLVCYLLGIDSADHLSIHTSRGAIFEGYILSEIQKFFFNRGETKPLYFWRDNHGNEIDCLIEHEGRLTAIEIKSTMTLRADLLRGLRQWQKISGVAVENCKLIYAGEKNERFMQMEVLSWKEVGRLTSYIDPA